MSDFVEGKGWVVKRKSETEVELVLPEGMKLTSADLSIEDIVEAVEKYRVITRGKSSKGTADEITMRCCSGNTAIAAL